MAPPAVTDPTTAAAAAFGGAASSATPSPTSSGAAIKQQFVDLRTAAIAHPHQLLTLTCYVPPTKIGSVIGRRGQSVLTLQREATQRSGGANGSVRVSIVGSGMNAGGGGGGPPISIPHHAQLAHSDPRSAWAPVVIRADPVGAFAAARLLTRDIGGLDCMDDVVVDVPIHRSRHASIIGRKGLTIASLSAEYDVRIMVPQKRGGVNQQQVLSAKQSGGGGGDEMLFPGTEESETKKSSGGKGAKKNKGGNKAAAKTEDDNSDYVDDDENNHREASDAAAAGGASYQSHRPTNVNVVQLEGQLDDVERCLVKVMAIAAGTSTGGGGGGGSVGGVGGVSSAGGKIKSADGKAAEGKDADIHTGAETNKKMTRAEKLKEKKREKKANAKAEKEAAAAAAAVTKAKSGDNGAIDVGEAAPEVDDQTGDIPMDIEIKPKGDGEAPVDDATAAASKEPKYSFAVVNATDETAHLMPSLRKLQALAKSTGAKIRRRKVDESPGGSGGGGKKGGDGNAPTDDDDGDMAENDEEETNDNGGGDDEDENEGDEDEEAGGEDAQANDDGAPGKQEITITGKTETVKAAISALEDIFGEGGCTYTLDALKTRKKKNGKRGGHQFRGKKKKKGGPGTKD